MSALPIKLLLPGFSHRLDVQSAAASLKSYRCIIWDSGGGSDELMKPSVPPPQPARLPSPPSSTAAAVCVVHMCSDSPVCSSVTSVNPQRNAILQLLHTVLHKPRGIMGRNGTRIIFQKRKRKTKSLKIKNKQVKVNFFTDIKHL